MIRNVLKQPIRKGTRVVIGLYDRIVWGLSVLLKWCSSVYASCVCECLCVHVCVFGGYCFLGFFVCISPGFHVPQLHPGAALAKGSDWPCQIVGAMRLTGCYRMLFTPKWIKDSEWKGTWRIKTTYGVWCFVIRTIMFCFNILDTTMTLRGDFKSGPLTFYESNYRERQNN